VSDQSFSNFNQPEDRPRQLPTTPIAGSIVRSRPQRLNYATNEVPLTLWPAPEQRTNTFDVGQIIAMLRRHRKLLLTTFGSVLGLSILFLLLAPRIYQSTATLQALNSNRDGGGNDALAVVSDMTANQGRTAQTQVEILKHDLIKESALRRLPAEERTIANKGSSTLVEPVGTTDLIEVSALARSPQVATDLANAICDEYIQLSTNKNQQSSHGATQYVETQLKTVRARLDKAQNALKQFKQQTGVFDLPKESANLVDQLGRVQSEWQQAKAQKETDVAQLNALKAEVARMQPSSIVPTGIVRRPAVETMKSELTKLQLDRIAKLREYKPQSRVIKDLDAQIAGIQQQLTGQAQTEVQGWKVEANPVRAGAVQEIARLQQQIWALEAQGHADKNASLQMKAELAKMPEREHRLGQLTMDSTALEQTYNTLNQKLQTLRITEKAHVANAQLMFPANPTEAYLVSPKFSRVLIMGVMGGLILALGLMGLLEWLDDHVHSEEEATQLCQLPVLAQVPYIEEKAYQSLYSQNDAPSPLLESFQMLRTNIDFSEIDAPIQSIVVTSSLPHEGKSMTALNLAVATALSGEKVILVDCDLRRPSLHRLLGIPNNIGFSNVVMGTHSLREAIQDTRIPGLQVITGGTIPPNPFKLLKSKAAKSCLQQISELADFVVIDTPPVLVMADAQVAASLADASLLVISSKDARRKEAVRTSTVLAQTGTEVLGIVLNKMDEQATGYYQYRYFSHYLTPQLPGQQRNGLLDGHRDGQLAAAQADEL